MKRKVNLFIFVFVFISLASLAAAATVEDNISVLKRGNNIPINFKTLSDMWDRSL